MPLISWIIPVFNRENLIHECLASILNSEWKDYEIILVDDASTDKSAIICDEYSRKYDFVKVIHLKENKGPGIARNEGIAIAQGIWLSFLDSDDLIFTKNLNQIVNQLYKVQDTVDMIAYNVITEYNGNEWNIPYYTVSEILKNDIFIKKYNTQISLPVWNYLFRNRFIKNNSLKFLELYAYEDSIFMLDAIYYADNIQVITDCFYKYRTIICTENNSLSKKNGMIYANKALNILFEKICHYIRLWNHLGQRDLCKIYQILLCQTTIDMIPAMKNVNNKFKIDKKNLGIFQYSHEEIEDYASELFYLILNNYKDKKIYISPAGIYGRMLADRLIKIGCNVLGFLDNYKTTDCITNDGNVFPVFPFEKAGCICEDIPTLVTSITYNHGKMKKELERQGVRIIEWSIYAE